MIARSAASKRALKILIGGRNAVASGSNLQQTRASLPYANHRQSRNIASSSKALAQSTSPPPSLSNPSTTLSLTHLENGNQKLEEGDVEGAKKEYERSVEVEGTGAGWYNLGVTQYHLKDIPSAITSWNKAIQLAPSTDVHMNIASAYIFSKPPQPASAIRHLKQAMEMSPEDPEIAFNLAAILESTNNLEPALQLYQKAVKGGIERAEQNVRSVAAKIATAEALAKDGKKGDTATPSI